MMIKILLALSLVLHVVMFAAIVKLQDDFVEVSSLQLKLSKAQQEHIGVNSNEIIKNREDLLRTNGLLARLVKIIDKVSPSDI